MKHYTNDIYPIALVLSYDAESINKHYSIFNGEDVPVRKTPESYTMRLARRTEDYYAMAVGIVFNKEITPKLAAHEAFHAANYMMVEGVSIPLSEYSEEAWAYLIGWIMECIYDFKENH